MAEFGAKLASLVQKGDVICLFGPLGAGKTTLARGFVRSVASQGEDLEVPSPTFTLVQTYETARLTVWHFDLYRLESPEEVYELGVEEALDTGVSLIEWPERALDLLPAERLEIHITPTDAGRQIRVLGDHHWATRIEEQRLSA